MSVRYYLIFILHSLWTRDSFADMEGFIVGGMETTIERYPHSAFVAIQCATQFGKDTYICGASILNQKFLLSASHCFEECDPGKSVVAVATGSALRKAVTQRISKITMHPDYDIDRMYNDIAVMMLQNNLRFGSKVKRILVMKNPRLPRVGYVAGWGLIDEENEIQGLQLKEAAQKLVPREKCILRISDLPTHSFCGENTAGYAAQGDSGSALIVDGFVQIGIVSYKNVDVSQSLVVYTNVSNYFDWIRRTMRRMVC